jgi:tRNA(Leu) C34 or U34 (ribose-2'-O)-methylase TrmL
MVHLAGYTARPPHPRVARAARGAEKLIAWKAWPDARPAAAWLKERGFTLVGLEPSPSACDFREHHYSWPLCIVLGNEALGIAPAVAKRLDAMIRIPMHGGKSSLNVVVALGILLYHIVSQPARPCAEQRLASGVDPMSVFLPIIDRAVTAPLIEGMRHRRGTVKPGTPSLTLFLEAPRLPACEVWGLPNLGGVLLSIRQKYTESMMYSDQSSPARYLHEESINGECVPAFSSRLPSTARALVFGAEMGLWQALHAEPTLQRLALDSFVFAQLGRDDPTGRVAPYVTRYLGAADIEEMQSMADLVLREVSRPLGGRWRETEFLVVPHNVSQNDTVDRLIRSILFGS